MFNLIYMNCTEEPQMKYSAGDVSVLMNHMTAGFLVINKTPAMESYPETMPSQSASIHTYTDAHFIQFPMLITPEINVQHSKSFLRLLLNVVVSNRGLLW